MRTILFLLILVLCSACGGGGGGGGPDGVQFAGCEGVECGYDGNGDWCGSCPGGKNCVQGVCSGLPYVPESCDAGQDCEGQQRVPGEDTVQQCVPVWLDQDGDGFGTGAQVDCVTPPIPDGMAQQGGDCNDGDFTQYPGVPEVCDDIDDNCDGVPDDGCDQDGDGYCSTGKAIVGNPAACPKGGGDCNDQNVYVNPGMSEVANDGLDNDCDGIMDMGMECPGQCTGHSVDAYICALELCLGTYLLAAEFSSPTGDDISQAWEAVSHFGSPGNDLSPWAGDSYGLLASGPVLGTDHSVDLSGGDYSGLEDPFSKDGYETHDNVEFHLKIQAPPNVTGFAVDYVFFSEEYHDWVCTSFNDKFYIFLSGPKTTLGKKEVINYTACSDPDSYHDFVDDSGKKWCYVAINTAYSEPCPNAPTNISGTGFECSYESCSQTQCECGMKDDEHGSSTGWLYTSWPIEPGEVFDLTFHIHDTSDGIYDSAVIIDNFRWMTTPFESGTVTK